MSNNWWNKKVKSRKIIQQTQPLQSRKLNNNLIKKNSSSWWNKNQSTVPRKQLPSISSPSPSPISSTNSAWWSRKKSASPSPISSTNSAWWGTKKSASPSPPYNWEYSKVEYSLLDKTFYVFFIGFSIVLIICIIILIIIGIRKITRKDKEIVNKKHWQIKCGGLYKKEFPNDCYSSCPSNWIKEGEVKPKNSFYTYSKFCRNPNKGSKCSDPVKYNLSTYRTEEQRQKFAQLCGIQWPECGCDLVLTQDNQNSIDYFPQEINKCKSENKIWCIGADPHHACVDNVEKCKKVNPNNITDYKTIMDCKQQGKVWCFNENPNVACKNTQKECDKIN